MYLFRWRSLALSLLSLQVITTTTGFTLNTKDKIKDIIAQLHTSNGASHAPSSLVF